jgi:hypothetical protein
MNNRQKSALLAIPVLMAGVGVFLMGMVTSGGWQNTLSAFTLHSAFLADATDGTAPPDYRFIYNHREEKKEETKEEIIMPAVLKEPTEHRCGVLIKRLDEEGRQFKKFDVAYMMVCYEHYPKLFQDFFKEL